MPRGVTGCGGEKLRADPRGEHVKSKQISGCPGGGSEAAGNVEVLTDSSVRATRLSST